MKTGLQLLGELAAAQNNMIMLDHPLMDESRRCFLQVTYRDHVLCKMRRGLSKTLKVTNWNEPCGMPRKTAWLVGKVVLAIMVMKAIGESLRGVAPACKS